MPSGPRIRTDNVFGTLTDNPLTNVATTMNSAGLANLAAVSSAHAVIVLDPLRAAGAPEIVFVTAHTGSATSATIVRGGYGTSARQHASGVLWVHAPTVEDAIRIVTSSTRPSDPYEGQMIYETDTDSYKGYNGSAWEDGLTLGAWTNVTPTLTQLGAVSKTTTYAAWTKVGRTVVYTFNLAATGAGTANNFVVVGVPLAAANANGIVGNGWIYDISTTTRYAGTWLGTSTTTAVLVHSAGAGGAWGTNPNLAMASGDLLAGQITYQAAS